MIHRSLFDGSVIKTQAVGGAGGRGDGWRGAVPVGAAGAGRRWEGRGGASGAGASPVMRAALSREHVALSREFAALSSPRVCDIC